MNIEQLKEYLTRVTNTQKPIYINGIELKEEYIIDAPNMLKIHLEKDRDLENMVFDHQALEFPIDRDKFEDRFSDFLDEISCDAYGFWLGEDKYKNDQGGVTTNMFEINPYYWGDDESKFDIPNFIYYPTDLRIEWYKYPLRDAWANREFTDNEFKIILENSKNIFRK